MEQNKVLMIIVSVAIFFVAVIGVGVALLYPGRDAEVSGVTESSVREFDPIEYVRRQDAAPLTEEESDPVIIVYGDTEPTAPADTPDRAPVLTEPDQVPTIRERPARQREPADVVERAPEPAPAPAPTPAPAPAPTPTPAPPTPTPRQVRVTEYWIQLIASPSRDRVSQAERTLTDHDLGGRITTRDVDGQVFYRLRVGPYETKAEAEQFLQWIRAIEGFGDAYISEEYPLRTVTS